MRNCEFLHHLTYEKNATTTNNKYEVATHQSKFWSIFKQFTYIIQTIFNHESHKFTEKKTRSY